MSGKSVIASKIDVENEAIKTTDGRIDKHKDHLKKYEEKLRTKFAAMEKSVNETKSQGNWLKMNMGLQDTDNNNNFNKK